MCIFSFIRIFWYLKYFISAVYVYLSLKPDDIDNCLTVVAFSLNSACIMKMCCVGGRLQACTAGQLAILAG